MECLYSLYETLSQFSYGHCPYNFSIYYKYLEGADSKSTLFIQYIFCPYSLYGTPQIPMDIFHTFLKIYYKYLEGADSKSYLFYSAFFNVITSAQLKRA